MSSNPYPEKITDEISGVEVPNEHHRIWQEGYEAGYRLPVCDDKLREDLLLEFTQEQILGLLPAQALIDYDRAKDVLKKVVKAQRTLTLEGCQSAQSEAVKAVRERIRQKLQHSGGVMDILWITEKDWQALSEGK